MLAVEGWHASRGRGVCGGDGSRERGGSGVVPVGDDCRSRREGCDEDRRRVVLAGVRGCGIEDVHGVAEGRRRRGCVCLARGG